MVEEGTEVAPPFVKVKPTDKRLCSLGINLFGEVNPR